MSDQVIASSSNLLIVVVAARVLSTYEFGAYALVFATYVLVLGLSRGLILEPLLIRGQGSSSAFEAAARAALGAMVISGTILGLAELAFAPILSGVLQSAFVALGILTPGLLLQDGYRYYFFAQLNPRGATVIDTIWLASMLILLLLVRFCWGLTLVRLVGCWGVGAAIAAVWCVTTRARPAVRKGGGWIRSNFGLGGRYAAESLGQTGALQLTVFLLGAVAGLPAVAAYRVGQTFFGPTNILFSGLYAASVPSASRRKGDDAYLRRVVLMVASVLTFATVAWTCVGLLIPLQTGRLAFGESWSQGRELLPLLGIAAIGGAISSGGIVGIRALGDSRQSLSARVKVLPLMTLGPVIGALAGGVRGMSLGLALAACISAAVWWTHWARASKESTSFGRPALVEAGPSVEGATPT